MKVIITGGAGFIGSCIVRMLNDLGISDIIIVDNINTSEKWLNIRNKSFLEYVNKTEFIQKLDEYKGITHIIHMGACSSTTEQDFDYLYKNNLEYSKLLWSYCSKNKCSFIYASSAATYGDGIEGFDDNKPIDRLQPLNRYGYSKQLFDLWTETQKETPPQHVGLKFFNVYGPNEYAKGNMASMVYHGYKQIMNTGSMKLFKSYREEYQDGNQLRDFVYVKDVCKVIKYFIGIPDISGLFNLGTGNAQSFRALSLAVFEALGMKPNIEYIEMPQELRGKYQYFTCAEMSKLSSVGYSERFYSVYEGANDYVKSYLSKEFEIY